MEQEKHINIFQFLVILPGKNLSGSVIEVGIQTDIGEKVGNNKKKKISECLAAKLQKTVLFLGPQRFQRGKEKIRQQIIRRLCRDLGINFYDVFLGLRSWEKIIGLNGLSKDLNVTPINEEREHSKTLFSFLF
ncbi:hypothetical protein A3A09_01255 [Candidatus Nomurabacteria bacterium RIFCSPLOWO2_01_FULL_42_20]|uniref:Uncharacterized protein n=1 Tax=Candidatus Nomurabacteria bacterium RIFCSPHIGHO2_01_FULL_42_16 TaxID=1801743 RepID=A0A1F6VI61_9BACT|nr:MAG: hypothetical protein A2824_01630 [Candidatus Nomurabacteria bacterium RIFCSPHIGHO2_01_FULL_42_16]OGI92366.1 MAG: hypothetical protein A3A09_01255 [Candidatus Nomurabacteria bacterium RIFCSPLOWO2_01_FULL_42_20]